MGSKLNFIVLLIVVLIILFGNSPYEVSENTEWIVDSGDTAWMIVSCAFVLLMTPGLAFFLWRNGEYKKYYFDNASKFCGSWRYKCSLGFGWI